MRDLLNNSTGKMLLAANRQSGDTSNSLTVETGTSVDLEGEGRKCFLMMSVGATSTATLNVTIQESVDDSVWTTLQELFADTAGLTEVDLAPTKRYIRALCKLSSTGAVSVVYVDVSVGVVVYNERYIPSNVA